MDTAVLVVSIPAVLAIVNLLKSFGLEGKWSALVAVVVGVALNVGQGIFGGIQVWDLSVGGLLIGLAAAGLYDVASTVSPPNATIVNIEPTERGIQL